MPEITYNNICNVLLEMFPEFKRSEKYFDESDMDSPYSILGNLGLMIFENFDKKNQIELAERLVKLTDEIMNNPDSEVELINLFQIEVFEKLVGSKTGAKLAKRLLHGKSLENLKQTLRGFRTKEFEDEYRKP